MFVREISLSKLKAITSDGLSLSFLKSSGKVLAQLHQWVCATEEILKNSCESAIVLTYKKSGRSSSETRRRTSLTSIASKLLASIVFHWSSSNDERCAHQNQPGFLPGRSSIAQMFTLVHLRTQAHILQTDDFRPPWSKTNVRLGRLRNFMALPHLEGSIKEIQFTRPGSCFWRFSSECTPKNGAHQDWFIVNLRSNLPLRQLQR